MDIDQLSDYEELYKATEDAKKKFKDEYIKETQFEERVKKEQAPVIEAIKETAKQVDKDKDPQLALKETEEKLRNKIEAVASTNYQIKPHDLKSLMRNYLKNGKLPILIYLILKHKFDPKISMGLYEKYKSKLLIFYALGYNNVARDYDRFIASNEYKEYINKIAAYIEQNSEQIDELYSYYADTDDDDDFDDDGDDYDDGGEDEENPLRWDESKMYDGQGLKYYNNPQQLVDRLAKLHATFNAGNTAAEVFNEANNIIKELLKIGHIITKDKYLELVKLF